MGEVIFWPFHDPGSLSPQDLGPRYCAPSGNPQLTFVAPSQTKAVAAFPVKPTVNKTKKSNAVICGRIDKSNLLVWHQKTTRLLFSTRPQTTTSLFFFVLFDSWVERKAKGCIAFFTLSLFRILSQTRAVPLSFQPEDQKERKKNHVVV